MMKNEGILRKEKMRKAKEIVKSDGN